MKKRLLTLTLALAMALSLVVPAYAANNSINSKIAQDMATMDDVYFCTDNVSVYSIQDGSIVYAYQLTEDVADYVSVQYNDDGSSVIDVWEKDRHDILTLLNDGTLYVNDQKITSPASTVSATGSESDLMPMVAFQYSYSFSPFAGTTASQYNVGATSQNKANIPLSKQIRKSTGAAIGALLAANFFPGNTQAASAASAICAQIGESIRSKAEEVASTSSALSYKLTVTGHPNNDTFKFYRKYAGNYYLGTNYTGTPTYKTFYELRTTLS